MREIRVDPGQAPQELRAGLREIMAEYGPRFSQAPDALTVTFERTNSIVQPLFF